MESGGTRLQAILIGVNGEIEDGESDAFSRHHSIGSCCPDIVAVLGTLVAN